MNENKPDISLPSGRLKFWHVILTRTLTLLAVGVLVLILPFCTNIFLMATCQPYEADSFNDGTWIVKSEQKGLTRFRSLCKAGVNKPALIIVRAHERSEDLVYLLASEGFAVLDLQHDSLKVYNQLADVPANHRAVFDKLRDR